MLIDRWEDLQQAVKNETTALDGKIAEWLEMRATTGKHIFCAAGCSNCCTLFVQSTLIEALLVAADLDAAQAQKLEEYVHHQSKCLADAGDFLAILRQQRQAIGPCPFLDHAGCCSIYVQRPLACRSLLSTKPAEWCSVDFSTLDPLEKRLYLESLERPVVSFPVHYVASTQNAAKEAESRLQMLMEVELKTSINGNFPLLVYLSYTNNLVAQIKDGAINWPRQLPASPFYHPFLLQIVPAIES